MLYWSVKEKETTPVSWLVEELKKSKENGELII